MQLKREFDFDGLIESMKYRSKFWLNIFAVVALVIFIIIFKVKVLDTSMTADELKASIKLFNVGSQWIEKEKIEEKDFTGIVLVPEFSFKVRNIGKRVLSFTRFLGVFRFLDTSKVIGEGYKMVFKKPLVSENESELVTLTSALGYRATSKQAFRRNDKEWRTALVEIYAQSRNSKMVFIKSYYISRRIEGMDIDIKIADPDKKGL